MAPHRCNRTFKVLVYRNDQYMIMWIYLFADVPADTGFWTASLDYLVLFMHLSNAWMSLCQIPFMDDQCRLEVTEFAHKKISHNVPARRGLRRYVANDDFGLG